MSKWIVAAILMLAGSCGYAGGSEVPWPEKSQQAVVLDDLTGVWVSTTQAEPKTLYYIYVQELAFMSYCKYLLGIDEIDAQSRAMTTRGSNTFCTQEPRQISFVMNDTTGSANKVINLVGVKKDPSDNTLGSQNLGLKIFNYTGDTTEPAQVDILYKQSNEYK